jgi:hypothetical protein
MLFGAFCGLGLDLSDSGVASNKRYRYKASTWKNKWRRNRDVVPVLFRAVAGSIKLGRSVTTPLYPTFEKRISDATERILRAQVDPWAFLNSGRPLKLTRFDGQSISHEGIGFEGSPQHVFWGRYIEPFLEDLTVRQIRDAAKEARERDVDGGELLGEVQDLLLAACAKVFRRMAEIDQRLLDMGIPEKLNLRSTDREYSAMRAFIEKHVRAELEMWKGRPWYEGWYERNKFFVWAIGVVVALAGLASRLL